MVPALLTAPRGLGCAHIKGQDILISVLDGHSTSLQSLYELKQQVRHHKTGCVRYGCSTPSVEGGRTILWQ